MTTRTSAALVVLAIACACAPGAGRGAARVLALEDARVADPAAWRPLLASPDDEVRRLAARGAGRVRDAALADAVAERLGAERAGPVREELVFALGQLAAASARGALEGVLADGTAGERALAAEALGKLGGLPGEPPLVRALDDEAPGVRAAAALALVRLRGRRLAQPPDITPAQAATLLERLAARLDDTDPAAAEAAAYALSEIPLPGRGPHLAALLGSQRPATRLFAVRGLVRAIEGAEAPASAADRLAPLVDDVDPHVAAAAAAGLGRLRPRSAVPALVRAAGCTEGSGAHHVRAAAVAALGAIHADGGGRMPRPVAAVLDAGLGDVSAAVRRAAFAARTAADPAGSAALVREWAASGDPLDRAASAAAAAGTGDDAAALLLGLAQDEDARPAAAALAALATLEPPPAPALEAARRAASRDDLAVRAAGLAALARLGDATDLGTIEAAYRASPGDERVEVRIEALRAADRLAGDAARPLLRDALGDPSPAVAGVAAELVEERTGQRPEVAPRAPRGSSVELVVGRDVLSGAPNPRAVLETEKGEIVLELYREEAPRHVKSFLELARAGTYDGLTFHRVVTGFVIQGLDPRGDGYGTGGVFLRDEINPVPYLAGALGMPNAGPDTAGCQVFVTHVPTPHLDGRYTVFGGVESGADVVDAIDVGDRVLRVTVR